MPLFIVFVYLFYFCHVVASALVCWCCWLGNRKGVENFSSTTVSEGFCLGLWPNLR